MPSVTTDQILEQLKTVQDPELHRDLVSLNMIKDVAIDGGHIKVHVELTTPACPMKETIAKDVTAAVKRIDGVESVELEWSAQVRQNQQAQSRLPGVKNVIAVGAGKGGVGKSTAAVLLAVGLQRKGARVGLMDADVYGPSIPKMMGVEDGKPYGREGHIQPLEAHHIKLISMGFMVDRSQPMIWRGPMVHGVVRQFLDQVDWGELDYLIVDLPPGTGDVPLTLAQSIPMTGAVVICTPQDVAMIDAERAVLMYRQLNIECLGIIENMSYFLCPHCGERSEIFDHGGAQRGAERMSIPFLGAIPLNIQLRVNGDAGSPQLNFDGGDASVQQSIDAVVGAFAGRVSVKTMLQVSQPTLTIERWTQTPLRCRMPRESIENKKQRSRKILTRLRRLYGAADCALAHDSAWQLLIATILSAQSTDDNVNRVTRDLFRKYRKPADFVAASRSALEQDIHATGFFRQKAKNIQGTCELLVSEFGGEVPQRMEDLLRLPGVARKTANVVLGTWFGRNEGVVVDTHVGRISERLVLTWRAKNSKDAVKIEQDLMEVLPRPSWTWFSHALIWHGRKVCSARRPDCESCGLAELCPSAFKIVEAPPAAARKKKTRALGRKRAAGSSADSTGKRPLRRAKR